MGESMPFRSDEELSEMGFAAIGRGVSISHLASFHGTSRISIGDHCRIDDFAVLSAGEGGISLGMHVHIAVFCSLIGKERIELHDFSGISARTSVFSSSDDFSGAHMTGPTIPQEYLGVISKPVTVGRHCVVGTGSVLLPGTVMGEGSTLGALSLAKGRLDAFTLYGGVPAVRIKARDNVLLSLERDFLAHTEGWFEDDGHEASPDSDGS
jgi:acetyltransferase-like isoleucine patch superfamily enzyme